MTPTESAISEAVTRLYLDTFGKGPMSVETHCYEDMAITLLRDVLTPGEHTLVGAGNSESVVTTRMQWQRATQHRFKSTIGEAAGRPVVSAVSGFEVDDALATEFFLFEPERRLPATAGAASASAG